MNLRPVLPTCTVPTPSTELTLACVASVVSYIEDAVISYPTVPCPPARHKFTLNNTPLHDK